MPKKICQSPCGDNENGSRGLYHTEMASIGVTALDDISQSTIRAVPSTYNSVYPEKKRFAGGIDAILRSLTLKFSMAFQGSRNQRYLIQYPSKALDFDIFEILTSRPCDRYKKVSKKMSFKYPQKLIFPGCAPGARWQSARYLSAAPGTEATSQRSIPRCQWSL